MIEAWQLIRRRWWLLLLGILAAALPTLLVSERLPRVYEARATVLVSPGSTELGSGMSPDQLTLTYASILKARPILSATAERAGLSREQVDASLNVVPVRDTRFVQLLVRATTPEQAAGLANVIATTAAEQVQAMHAARYNGRLDRLSALVDSIGQDVLARSVDLQALSALEASPERDATLGVAQAALVQTQQRYRDAVARLDDLRLAQLGGAETMTIVEPALAPQTPVLPRPGADVFTAVVVGLVIALVLALLLDRFVDSLPTLDDWPDVLDTPVLGVFQPADPGTLTSLDPGQFDDAFKRLRVRLAGAGPNRAARTLAVTSVAEWDGATTVAAGFATALARAGERVILIDANLPRPALADLFNIRPQYSLSTLLADSGIPATSAVVATNVGDLRLLAAGSASSETMDPLSSPGLGDRLSELCELADLVVLDVPALTCSEVLILTTRVDAVICVLDPIRTSLSTTRQAIAQFRAVSAPLVGVVLNRAVAPHVGASGRDAVGLQPSARQS